jgi:undecaprenyl-diphosphatase
VRPSVRDALLLGAVQGPTELLPVSSSAHIALVRRALGAGGAHRAGETRPPAVGPSSGTRGDSDPTLDAALEVALHGGAALALLLAGRDELRRVVREATPRRFAAGVLAGAVPAAAGYLLERFPPARLDGPRSIAAGLALGGAAMGLADSGPQRRPLADVGPRDGLALGVAQALALLPGVSRNGATLTAARARGLAREDAQALSWRVGLPVLFGATGLRAWHLRGWGSSRAQRRTLAIGAGAAFVSTLGGARLLGRRTWRRPLLPFALYRVALALLLTRAK